MTVWCDSCADCDAIEFAFNGRIVTCHGEQHNLIVADGDSDCPCCYRKAVRS